ncbi:hypothetical protein [Flavobacterium sp. WG21]|uniref:hypothetical protein n=1 Tax=Flavobacterium sp. WG21 TaxID=1229487 RepID=UPI0012FA997A|nr:hypothetical protein [Flavobacterium sp. WG21]
MSFCIAMYFGYLNLFFDDLYNAGFGFKDEINMTEKPLLDLPIAAGLIEELKLLPLQRMRKPR